MIPALPGTTAIIVDEHGEKLGERPVIGWVLRDEEVLPVTLDDRAVVGYDLDGAFVERIKAPQG